MPLSRYLVRRLAWGSITLVVASFVVFLALYLAPGDPVRFLLGSQPATPELRAALREQYHLDDPFLSRYLQWLGDVVRGDFGTSVLHDQNVSSMISSRIGTTLLLVGLTLALVLVVSVALGIASGLREGPFADAVSVGTMIAVATPNFVVAIVLIIVFGTELQWFPVYGTGEGLPD